MIETVRKRVRDVSAYARAGSQALNEGNLAEGEEWLWAAQNSLDAALTDLIEYRSDSE